MTTLFYSAGAVAVVASLLAVTRTHVIHALLHLVVALLAVALVFLSLGAPFLAALEVIVYAGAIMVLFLFVIMMLNLGESTRRRERDWLPPRAWVVPTLLAGALLVAALYGVGSGPGDAAAGGAVIGPDEVGRALFTDYVIGVEIASALLLAGLVAAWYLGVRRRRGEEGSP